MAIEIFDYTEFFTKHMIMSIDEVRKSFSSILYERTTSPFYGTFIFAWALWNWRILYITFFVNQELIKPLTKIQYIENKYLNLFHGFLYPLASTLFLILLVPFLSNVLYKASLHFEGQRVKLKQEKEKDRLITKEQYGRLITEMNDLDIKYEANINRKDIDIKLLNDRLADANASIQLHNNLRVLLAKYGLPGKSMTDITQPIINNTQQSTQFQLSNENLGITQKNDPAFGQPKKAQIIYEYNRQPIEIWANENDYLWFNSNEILVDSKSFQRPPLTARAI